MVNILYCFGSLILSFLFPVCAAGQPTTASDETTAKLIANDLLFQEENILHFKIEANFREILKHRSNDTLSYKTVLSYKKNDNNEINIPIKMKVRGNFRRQSGSCSFPPLLLNFQKKKQQDSTIIFYGQDKLKLVTHCQSDEYVIREWLVYKLYNLITDKSFRVRLVRVDYVDPFNHGTKETHYGFLLENESVMARRNHAFILNKKMRPMETTNHDEFIKMAIFEYMIGNTDWSVPYLHNIRLLSTDSTKAPYAVPYDFDYSGIVSAPYAIPPEELEISSVRVRLYRGFCTPYTEFEEPIKLFNTLKDKFYSIYMNCSLLNNKYIKQTTRYLDEFYKTINNEKLRIYQFGLPCTINGKKNIIIKGFSR